MSARSERTRGLAGGPLVRLGLAIVALVGLGYVDTSAGAVVADATCDALTVPSLDLTRCVVEGGQAEIDAGSVVRVTYLSSDTVHWLAGHRTSHGATFAALTDIRIGALVFYRERAYVVTAYELVDRYQSDSVMSWVTSSTPSVVLQTSATGTNVHAWRAVELVPSAPIVATAPPPVPGA